MGNKRVFSPTTKRQVKNIRSGQGHYTKKLAAGATDPTTKRRAAQEASAAEGGSLPRYVHRAAKAGRTSVPASKVKKRKRSK
jgi:hypothetical protein